MSLEPGVHIAHYEIVASIGAGGMGAVYRARDTKLKRDVAIKVLPEAFAKDAQRVKRLIREAEVLASLNHPNVAAIYGLEDGALVLELVEGVTLAERLASGPLPLEEAIAIARQIAGALEAAHERGIVHRDLKPANVILRADGTVKVLDFGLAKALGDEPESGGDPYESPTRNALSTGAGTILGTAAYMSPEQARGESVDRRADIWAFGAVLYELLSGTRAFRAGDVSSTLAEVLKSSPDWDALPSGLSSSVRVFLTRCLVKDAKERLRDIGDMRLALDGAFEPEAAALAPRRLQVERAWVGGVALLVGLALGWLLRVPEPRPVARLTIEETPQFGVGQRDLAVAPDGTWVVLRSDDSLVVRRLDRFDSTRLDTVQPRGPFVSPDGQWIAFGSAATLQRISPEGGSRTTLCEAVSAVLGGSWGDDGTIVFATRAGLFQVSPSEGTPRRLTDAEGASHIDPEILPGSRHVLFTIGGDENGRVDVGVLSLESGETHVLIPDAASPRYLESGHLAYVVGDTIYVVPFDPERLTTTGEPTPIATGVLTKQSGVADFDLSSDGLLAYIPRSVGGGTRRLVWVDREGRREPLPVEPRDFIEIDLSPEGDRIAAAVVGDDGSPDIWIHDRRQGTFTRLTFDTGSHRFPVWMPDGVHVTYRSNGGIARKAADGTGTAERLTEDGFAPLSVSPEGEVVGTQARGVTWDIVGLKTRGEPRLRILSTGAETETNAAVSPSGRFLAFGVREESGEENVIVTTFPNVDAGRWQISTDGGGAPNWARDESELFYFRDNELMAVPLRTGAGGGLEPGAPTPLFEGPYRARMKGYAVAPDGRFLMLEERTSESPRVRVVLNWREALR